MEQMSGVASEFRHSFSIAKVLQTNWAGHILFLLCPFSRYFLQKLLNLFKILIVFCIRGRMVGALPARLFHPLEDPIHSAHEAFLSFLKVILVVQVASDNLVGRRVSVQSFRLVFHEVDKQYIVCRGNQKV